MSASSYQSRTRRRRSTTPYDRRPTRRRKGARTLVALALVALAVWVVVLRIGGAVHRLELPLADVAVIRQQAADKHLDPALIAAVIYAESKFDPRPSAAGAQGLMQILPSTAHFLAHLSGGARFQTSDLATPAVNVAYGSYYLRYLLDHYEGNEMLALAAYNAGLTNVDEWIAKARAQGMKLSAETLPFSETRAYVQKVLNAQQAYRQTYSQQLGISP